MASLRKKWSESKETVTSELRIQAQKHADRPNSRLALLPNDTAKGSGRGIERKVDANPKSRPENVRFLAGIAEPHFETMLSMILDNVKTREQFRFLGEAASANAHTSVVTLHEKDPVDIPIAEALTLCALHELGFRPKFGLVISKIMAHLGFQLEEDGTPQPAVSLLAEIGDVYLSFPRTESIKKSNIADDVISLYNRDLRWHVGKSRKEGNFVLAAAPTGTMGRPDDEDPTIINIAHVSEATTKMVGGLLLPVALRIRSPEPFFQALPIRAVSKIEEMDATMLELCRTTEDLAENRIRLNYHGLSLLD